MKLNGELKIRIEQDQIQTFKDHCKDAGVKYTIVIRNIIQEINTRSSEELQILGRKK